MTMMVMESRRRRRDRRARRASRRRRIRVSNRTSFVLESLLADADASARLVDDRFGRCPRRASIAGGRRPATRRRARRRVGARRVRERRVESRRRVARRAPPPRRRRRVASTRNGGGGGATTAATEIANHATPPPPPPASHSSASRRAARDLADAVYRARETRRRRERRALRERDDAIRGRPTPRASAEVYRQTAPRFVWRARRRDPAARRGSKLNARALDRAVEMLAAAADETTLAMQLIAVLEITDLSLESLAARARHGTHRAAARGRPLSRACRTPRRAESASIRWTSKRPGRFAYRFDVGIRARRRRSYGHLDSSAAATTRGARHRPRGGPQASIVNPDKQARKQLADRMRGQSSILFPHAPRMPSRQCAPGSCREIREVSGAARRGPSPWPASHGGKSLA